MHKRRLTFLEVYIEVEHIHISNFKGDISSDRKWSEENDEYMILLSYHVTP